MKSSVISLLNGSAMTGVVVVTSDAQSLNQVYGYAIQAVWTGTPTGELKLQGSCDAPSKGTMDPNDLPGGVTNWSDITNSNVSIMGAAGNYMWNVADTGYRWVRLVYTNTSGTGSLSANMCAKGV